MQKKIHLLKLERSKYDYPIVFDGYCENNKDFTCRVEGKMVLIKYGKDVYINTALNHDEFSIYTIIYMLNQIGVDIVIDEYYDEEGNVSHNCQRDILGDYSVQPI